MRHRYSGLVRLVLWAAIILAACTPVEPVTSPATPNPEPSSTPTRVLPTPVVRTTRLPDANIPAVAFLEAWVAEDYPAMYALLDKASRASLTLDEFSSRYRQVAYAVTLQGLDYTILEAPFSNQTAEVRYRVTLHSQLFGDLNAETRMALQLEEGEWRIRWAAEMILPQLAEGRNLSLDVRMRERGAIYDRAGAAIAGLREATAVGFYPEYMDPEQEDFLVSILAQLAGVHPLNIIDLYQDAIPGTVGYLPIAEVDSLEYGGLLNRIAGMSGVVIAPYAARFYPDGGVAPHAVGYTSAIQQGEEEDRYRRLGYLVSESVGRVGLEAWGEKLLGGPQQATLYQVAPDGNLEAILGEASFGPAQSITTTLESDLQVGVQNALRGFRGAAVVLERDTGRVLALASSPGFDSNAYQTANFNWLSLLNLIGLDSGQPTFNRVTQGQYPLGSVFKIITLSATLESGVFKPEDTYNCQYTFTEVAGLELNDWTYDKFLKDGKTQPSGLLTLPESLVRSCNPWYWKMGLEHFNRGLTTAIADMASGFGLGQLTGITGVEEQAGRIPLPTNQVDAVNLAIGQGDTQVTPLQVARFVAAVGNGGTLYRPQIIEAIQASSGEAGFRFQPEASGFLPVTPENLEIVQKAMVDVIRSQQPRGTAYNVFLGLDLPIAGKTGTAQSGFADPHAWFAGYTFAGREGRPDIAVAVLVENGGEGSEIAAPIFRRIIELYFFGRPIKIYPWETTFGVTDTPTPYGFGEETPSP